MFKKNRLIIGLGRTGYSVARYWHGCGVAFKIIDTRNRPPAAERFKKEFPKIPLHTGSVNLQWLQASDEIILSPGVDPVLVYKDTPQVRKLTYSDIDLFNRVAEAPVIAVTGSNGKSTVTRLIEHLLSAAGYKVKAGGNLGTPALDLLAGPIPDFYVLELSSFQLAITKKLQTIVSIFLNFATDHLDRHLELAAYHRAKQMIYRHCKTAICNQEDAATYPRYRVPKIIKFGTQCASSEFGLMHTMTNTWLAQKQQPLVDIKALPIQGAHNYLNVLAALATVRAVYCPISKALSSLPHFKGMHHRLERVYCGRGIQWINDSKATNSHATKAALSSFGIQDAGRIILIAGGIYKTGDNLATLIPLVLKYVKKLILIGKDAPKFKEVFIKTTSIDIMPTLSQAVQKAVRSAIPGDTVLFSPACDSRDMFTDYAERGGCFTRAVKSLYSSHNTCLIQQTQD